MALTRSLKETVEGRMRRDPAFKAALRAEAVSVLLEGDLETGKAVLADYINATLGFEALAEATGTLPKTLRRMFSAAGRPSARSLLGAVRELQSDAGVTLHVSVAQAPG